LVMQHERSSNIMARLDMPLLQRDLLEVVEVPLSPFTRLPMLHAQCNSTPWTRDTSRSRRVLNCRLQVNSITFRCLAMCVMICVLVVEGIRNRERHFCFMTHLSSHAILIWAIRSDTRRRNGRVWGASTVGKRVLTNTMRQFRDTFKLEVMEAFRRSCTWLDWKFWHWILFVIYWSSEILSPSLFCCGVRTWTSSSIVSLASSPFRGNVQCTNS
jgi:hypothetical protein